MSITIEKEGRRHYIVGAPYAIKDTLRNAGCTWDPQRKCWWTGKQEIADRFAGREVKAQPREEVTGRSLEVIGRAEYKGRQYLVVWTGQTKYGTGWKLAFRDGSKVFWAGKDEQPQWVKQYQEPTTVGRILDFIKAKEAEKEAANKAAAVAKETAKLTSEQILETAKAEAEKVGVEVTGEAIGFTAREPVRVGDIRSNKKHGHVIVAAVGEYERYYHSEDECEDMDCFCGHYGWQESQQYWGVPVSEPQADREAREKREAEVKAKADAAEKAKTDYAAAKAEIPADYKMRHGAMLGGNWSIGEVTGTENPPPQPVKMAYERMAALLDERNYGETLSKAVLPDGRPVYRVDSIQYDDYRTTTWMPADVWESLARAEIAEQGITPEKAAEWLKSYRGCVGSELYEFAATLA